MTETTDISSPNEEIQEVLPATDQPAPDLGAIRELVLKAHPDVVPELIAGDSVESLLASVAPAEAAYHRLAGRFSQEPAAPPVPAGGERPLPVDPARLPASEKIRRGLAHSTRQPRGTPARSMGTMGIHEE